jgi:hypothetical protein
MGLTAFLKVVLHVAVLVVGSTVLSVVYEKIQGNESFSLPFFNILLITCVGGILSYWYGWLSTGIVLAVYGAFCIIGGFLDRVSPVPRVVRNEISLP